MITYKEKLTEISHFFENNDTNLGFRKLLDAVADTQDIDLYKEAIQLTDYKESKSFSEHDFIQKSQQLIQKLHTVSIQENQNVNNVIIAKDIFKSYGFNRFSLGNISLEIKKGQVYGLVGENGNGKTTLLRILAKELSHNSGSLQYNFDTEVKDEYQLRTKLVYIPQRTEKWYGSLQDNLRFVLSNYKIPAEEIDTRVLLMIARFGLWNYKHLKWSELSSGYKMRFELARTLLRKPEVLLLDEPLANLDVLAQQVILEDLKSICNSISHPIALILSSQQLYEVEKISDKVIYLKNGKYKENLQEESQQIDNQLIIEIDTNNSREDLLAAFQKLQLEKLIFNGGIFVAYFPATHSFAQVLSSLGNNNIEVTYVRNISLSTRRFFVY